MDFIVWIWLGLLVLFIVFELMTTSLTTIWFAGGALVAICDGSGGIAGVGTDCRIFCCVNCAAYFYETGFLRNFSKWAARRPMWTVL